MKSTDKIACRLCLGRLAMHGRTARRRCRVRGGTLLALALVSTLVLGGCATMAVWDKWHTRDQISSIAFEVREARSDDVEISWRALLSDRSELTGVLEIQPQLEDCERVQVLLAVRSAAPVSLTAQERIFMIDELTTPDPERLIWSRITNPSCKVLFVFRRPAEPEVISVSASWRPDAISSVDRIAAPRHSGWLALLPAAAVADTAAGIMIVPALACLGMKDGCGQLLVGVANDARR